MSDSIIVPKEEYDELLNAMERVAILDAKLHYVEHPLRDVQSGPIGLASYFLPYEGKPIFFGVIKGINDLCNRLDRLYPDSEHFDCG